MDYTRRYNYRSCDDICKDIHRIRANEAGEYIPLVSNPDVDIDLFLKADTTFKDYTFLDSCLPPEYSYKLANDLVMSLPLEERQMLMPRHPEKYVNTPLLLHRCIIDNLGLLASPKDKFRALAFCDICKCSTPRQVLLMSIATDPHYRGGGLGTLALEHAIEWCRFAKYKSILYGAVPENEASIALAQKLGFKVNDKESTDTDIVLELKL
jgi:GNAT superfamily N-acetyltransferase